MSHNPSLRPWRRLGVLLFSVVLLAALLSGQAAANERKAPRFLPLEELVPPPHSNPPPTVVEAPVEPAVTNAMDALDDSYRLAIGDRLSFRIIEDEEGPRPLIVTDSGDLEVPLLGRFPAAGRTCKELAHALKAEFEKDYYYNATVIVAVDVMTGSRGKVYLVGPVRQPGPQDIPSDEVLTVSKAIMRAGGFGDFADRRRVKITRSAAPGREELSIMVDVAQILERGRMDLDVPLEAGDLIYIPERLIRF